MHPAVLDRDIQKMPERALAAIRQLGGLEHRIETLADAVPVCVHGIGQRPVGRLVGRQIPANRVDAKCKQVVEFGVKIGQMARPAEQIPIECFEMADVENNTVPLIDGAVVDCLRFYRAEDRVRFLSCLQ